MGTPDENSPQPSGSSQHPSGVAAEDQDSQSSVSLLLLLLPHLSLALLILLLLFADFLMYRRRVRFQQKRAFDKQELMQTFPRRAISGLYRPFFPRSVNNDTPHHTTPGIPHRTGTRHHGNKADRAEAPARLSTSSSPSSTTSLASQPSLDPGPVSTESPDPQRKVPPRLKSKLRKLRSFTVASSEPADSAGAADKKKTANGTPAALRSRLEKRETCPKLPAISAFRCGSPVVDNGFAPVK